MNTRNKSSVVILYLLLFFYFENNAQQLPVNLRFNKFTTENGLSDNFIHDIIKDRQGYLWIATQNGMNRFDGVEFKTFFNNPDDSNSLTSSYVSFLAEDSLGRIWAATAGGLSMYNPSTGKFWNFIPSKSYYSKSRVYKVLRAHDGSIWFSTKNHLSTVNQNTFQITSYAIDSTTPDLRNTAIDNFFEDHYGNFWFDSYHGLCLFERKTHQVKVMDVKWGLSSLYDDGSGECWMGCWFKGLRNYNFSTGKFTDYYFAKKEDSVITRDVVSIERINYPGLESYLWIGTDHELAVFDLRTKSFIKYYLNDPMLYSSLPPGFVYKIFYDGRNEIWLATEHGLHTARLNQLAFQTYFFPDLKTSSVTSIHEDMRDSNHLLISLYPGGIYRMNRNTGVITDKFIPEKKMKYAHNYIQDFVQDSAGRFWTADFNGLGCFYRDQNKFVPLSKEIEGFGAFDSTVFWLHMDTENSCWLASPAGLGKFDLRTKTYSYFPHYQPRSENENEDHKLRGTIEDFDGNFWLSSKAEGILLFNPRTEKFKGVPFGSEVPEGTYSTDMVQADDSTIWFTTGSKIYFKRKNDGGFHLFRCEKVNATIYGVVTDAMNNVYLSTQTGLIKYEKATGRFIKFTTSDGLNDNSILYGIQRGTEGELYLRGVGFITIIRPENLSKNYMPASIVLDGLRIGSQDSAVDFKKFTTTPLSLNYTQNQFSVKFRLLNFEDAPLIKYSYILEGWDKQWISSGINNYASYSNLSGGDYVFRVKAIDPDGIENPEQATITVHIDTPFWNTLWFRILIAAAVTALIYFIYRLRIQRLLAVERIRSQISRDLHDEIGASLSSVQIMSAFAEQSLEETSPDAKQWVNRIGTNTKEMMEKIRDIVWTLNSSKEISGNIITRMNQFISHTLEPKDIECNFIADEKVNEALTDFVLKRNVYLIFKEAVNNVAKYAECTEVNISLKIESNKFMLAIADNGKGFDAINNSTGNGLKNMRQRATQINASLEISSSSGKGTLVSLTLPLPHLRYRFLKKAS